MRLLRIPFILGLLAAASLPIHGEVLTKTPTLSERYPQLNAPGVTSQYYRDPAQRPHLSREAAKPDFASFLAGLEPIPRPSPGQRCVEVIPISGEEYFILCHRWVRDALPSVEVTVYHIMPGTVEQLAIWEKSSLLYVSPIGITRRRYDYDQEGRLRRFTSWRDPLDTTGRRQLYTIRTSAALGNQAPLAPFRPPVWFWLFETSHPAYEELYEYWPITGAPRTITSVVSDDKTASQIRHFDESGNEIKQQP
jgi:hypothetical protein